MEGEVSIVVTCLYSALGFFQRLDKEEGNGHLECSIKMMSNDLRFLIMLLWGLYQWEDLECDWHLYFTINTVIPKLSQLLKESEADCRRIDDQDQTIDWEAVICDLEKAIQQLKPQLKEICMIFSVGAFRSPSCPPNQDSLIECRNSTVSLTSNILQRLRALNKSNLMAKCAKKQIASIQEKLEEIGTFVVPVNLPIAEVKKLSELLSHAQTWSYRISCLTYLYWLDQGKDDSLASSMETVYSDLLHKTMSCVRSPYIQFKMIPQLVAGYLDFLLQDFVIVLAKDDLDILHEGLIFLWSFIIDPPEDDSEDGGMVRTQTRTLVNEFSSLMCSIHGEIRGTCKAVFLDLVRKIKTVKAKVTNLYLMNPYSPSQLNSPKTNAMRFLDSVIGNLKNMLEGEANLIPSIKSLCELLVTELVSLRPVVYSVTEVLQEDECEKIQDLQREIMNMVYNTGYFIRFFPARSFSMWYGIIALPNIIEHLNIVKTEIENIGADKIYMKRELSTHEVQETVDLPLSRVTTFKMNGVFTGFREIAKLLSDELTRGQKCLTIISISGSAGQGKTTLAKKIYNDRSIIHHFHKIAWCYVSKDCPTREILVQIIGDDHKGVDLKGLEKHDLVDHLRKILKGRRYLIVMDDIWDVDAWEKLEWSFPDDNNGSRLLFTSRNHDLALQAKSNSISHRLPLFSVEESWELIKKMVFHSEVCPEEFVVIGTTIASYCKGLPLAVSLIAGVLRRTDHKLELWDGVAKNLKSHLAREGCTNVLELSYKYLADHLKSCFLYFGAFPRGENISAKKLKLLWIAEGFVNQSSEDLATDYLKDLVSQSLVVVTERSSMNGIKRCNLHDLLYDLCLEKAKEDNFLNWAEESLVLDQCSNCSSLHRLHIGIITDPFIESRPIVSNKKLPTGPLHSLLWSGNSLHSRESSFGFLKSLKLLTVLDVDIHRSMMSDCGNIFPEVILSMLHLRYLALQFLVPEKPEIPYSIIRSIPPAISKLRFLETLIVDFIAQVPISLPVSMWEMQRLRHIAVRPAVLDLLPVKTLSLPDAFSNIERLGSTYLLLSDCKTADFLQKFPKLKKLECSFRGHISQLFSILASLTQLVSLKIVRILSWQRMLHSFKKNPSFSFSKVENLKKLSLVRLEVPWSVLSDIGKHLPALQVLKIIDNSFVGSIWILKDGDFSKLRHLELALLKIENIDVSNCGDSLPFPSLEHLFVKSCLKLVKIPSIFGEISSLNKIQVVGCSTKVENSALEILEQQRDFGNLDLELVIRRR